MSMQAESLEVLEKADVPPSQARAILRAIEIEITGATEVLATKHDILLLRTDFHQESALLRSEIAGLQTQIDGLRAGTQTQTDGVRGDMRAEMREATAQLRVEMAEQSGKLRAEIRASASSITRQMYGALLGQMAVLLGAAYFFVTHLSS